MQFLTSFSKFYILWKLLYASLVSWGNLKHGLNTTAFRKQKCPGLILNHHVWVTLLMAPDCRICHLALCSVSLIVIRVVWLEIMFAIWFKLVPCENKCYNETQQSEVNLTKLSDSKTNKRKHGKMKKFSKVVPNTLSCSHHTPLNNKESAVIYGDSSVLCILVPVSLKWNNLVRYFHCNLTKMWGIVILSFITPYVPVLLAKICSF